MHLLQAKLFSVILHWTVYSHFITEIKYLVAFDENVSFIISYTTDASGSESIGYPDLLCWNLVPAGTWDSGLWLMSVIDSCWE